MDQALVIVESPAKAKTISKFLGRGYKVLACKGHVRALPSKQGSVEINGDVVAKYHILPESKKYLAEISKALKQCSTVYLATDLDREGEAIAWHLVAALKLDAPQKGAHEAPVVRRITFHEITREAIQDALKNPRDISTTLVDAQQARVVLDYLVGFNLSPFLWKKIRYGLSAGRVQSVALRLICEREQEIRAFKQQEYWTIRAQLTPAARENPFAAHLVQIDGKKLDKLAIGTEQQAQEVVTAINGAPFSVAAVQRKEIRRTPPPPFITSTLQQEAARKLGFSARKTMSIAQRLYEGVDVGSGSMGLITYMRTDSVHLAPSALKDIRDVIVATFGEQYALTRPRHFTQKSKNVQEAHEAIRPTDVHLLPENVQHALSADEYKLYSLIWKRAVASQMAAAVLDSVSVDIRAGERFLFRATGSTVTFPGYLQLYREGKDNGEEEQEEGMLPPLAAGDVLRLIELVPEQHFTQSPPRYTEATLVKALEEYGIGRPSTYASIISILQERKYVKLVKKRFYPEDIGMIVNDLLVNHFSKYVDYGFTSYMEDRLDQIARGEAQWKPAIKEFWKPFISLIRQKEAEIQKADVTTEKTEEVCPQCGKGLVIRLGRYGRFFACSGFPACRFVRPLEKQEGHDAPEDQPQLQQEVCEVCGKPLVLKRGRYGTFLGCSGYPECTFIKPRTQSVNVGVACPACAEGTIMEKKSRRGKVFYSCSRYPQCTFALWDKPLPGPCPECGSSYLLEKNSKRSGRQIKCPNKACSYVRRCEEESAADTHQSE
ncbi:MAG: type I DNA topoisomerase [Desulfobacterota bacterium]|nr:type I DNA topoisomerase [Thermodesulfobacteriota bacterium]